MERSTAHTLTRAFAALLWVSGILLAIGGLTLLFAGRPSVLTNVFGPASEAGATGLAFAGAAAITTGIIMLLFALLYIGIGYGLWTMRPWARIAALVISIISLFAFPLGTLVGIIGIWMFGFDPTVKAMFHDPTHTRAYGVAGRRFR
jgi:hypothetical protein